MKRFLEILKPSLCRPIVYSALLKLALGMCVALIWNRYIAPASAFVENHLRQGFFFLAVYFVLWTWLQYLAFDGMRSLADLFRNKDTERPRPNMPFRLKDLLNTDVDAFEGLDEEEKTVCRLCADAIVAIVFLVVYLIFGVI